ncbi:MAG: carbohydrate kinase family protein [Candidatus Izimaplasma sp.]|nr:carbohydrate kinase family protein [Candidatus Izimaplasma bacterium]
MTFKKQVISKLQKKDPTALNMVIGFDGFVDEIIDVVNKRSDSEHYKRVDTIKELAQRIERAANLSTNIELVPKVKKIGGNGPIMCNAMSEHGSDITYIGALGFPTVDDVFTSMKDNVTLLSFANNGHTDALEFDDGKLMLGKMASLNDVTYDNLLNVIDKETLIDLLNKTDLFATVNWSMLPYMTELWDALISHILPHLDQTKRHLFVDLADPEKRENDAIKKALTLLQGFKSKFNVTLGLNKKEAYDIAKIYQLFDEKACNDMRIPLEDIALSLYNTLALDTLVIHPVEMACCVVDNVYYEVDGPYTPKPKLTTGAGDNFNAGFMLGQLLNLDPKESLLTGVATSGFYVREAKSPKFKELISFIKTWDEDQI